MIFVCCIYEILCYLGIFQTFKLFVFPYCAISILLKFEAGIDCFWFLPTYSPKRQSWLLFPKKLFAHVQKYGDIFAA